MKDKKEHNASETLNHLVDEKKEALDKANRFQFLGTLVRGGVGAIVGLGASVSTVIMTLNSTISKLSNSRHDEIEKMVQAAESNLPKSKNFIESLSNTHKYYRVGFDELSKDAETVSKVMLKHPVGIVAGATAAGTALGLYWQHRVNVHHREKAQQDFNDVEKVQKEWSERTAERGERQLG